jgi:hypothetical protein
MALESGNGRSSGKCPLTSNGYHLHSRSTVLPPLDPKPLCDVSKKCYRCSRLARGMPGECLEDDRGMHMPGGPDAWEMSGGMIGGFQFQ